MVVDWGARNGRWPVGLTANAPWIGLADGAGAVLVGPEGPGDARNHATRAGALAMVEAVAVTVLGPVLCGIDAGVGYPAGFAAAAGFGDREGVWHHLGDVLPDEENRNDRWAVAAALNRRFAGPGPFWGRPHTHVVPDLPTRKVGIRYASAALPFAERRLTELVVPWAQPVFKLAYTGSVGSQTLLAIAHLQRLCDRRGTRVAVWPFDPPPYAPGQLVMAEVYPSAMVTERRPHPAAGAASGVVDANQVLWAAQRLAAADVAVLDVAALPAAAPAEEGWMLGIAP